MVVGYQIGRQDANSRTWLKIVQTTDAQGNTVLTTNRAYVELATGLNYKDPTTGQWLPTKEEIDAYPGGAIAQFGEHRVIFANNINSSGAIDLQMPQTNGAPGGQEMKSDTLGLAYYDPASGKSMLIAQVQDSQGQIVGSNQVVYPDAMSGVRVNVAYRYTKAGLSQDVVLLTQLPSPESFGLSSTYCVLQVLTEFSQAPVPVIQTAPGSGSNGQLPDATVLDFGTMRMIRGRAFLLGTNSPAASVAKQWITVSNRTVLVESVRLSAITNSLAKLPAFSRTSFKPSNGSPLYAISTKRLLPAPRVARVDRGQMELAKATPPHRGFLLDYQIINADQNNYTFQGDTTYYISAAVNLTGTTTIQAGTVLKYAVGASLNLGSPATVNDLATEYRPAILTGKDDNSVGGTISGSSGNPLGNYYANPALSTDSVIVSGGVLPDLRILYASQAVNFWDDHGGTHFTTYSGLQVVNCANGVNLSASSLNLYNVLFANVGTCFNNPYSSEAVVINGTFANLNYLSLNDSGGFEVFVTNSILANVANLEGFQDSAQITGDYNGFDNTQPFGGLGVSPSVHPFFKSVVGGNYYLVDQCGFQGKGTTAIDPAAMADIADIDCCKSSCIL